LLGLKESFILKQAVLSSGDGKMFALPKLPYEYNALEPWIDEMTMTIHHTKHHQGYVDNLNKAVAGTRFESMNIEDILKNLNAIPESIRTVVRNHGGGHYNHSLFWKMMAPGAGGEPSGNLGDAIKTKFGGFDRLKESLTNAGLGRFGSGWAWLVSNAGELEVLSTANQDNPISEGKQVLLGIDVWEHAYYLKHKWNRKAYLEDFFHVVNWGFVEELYKG